MGGWKETEESVCPHHGGSTPRVVRLRERLENSNCIVLKIAIEIHLFERGLQVICMDSHRLSELLGLSETAIEHLGQAGLVRVSPPTPRPKERVSYSALAAPLR